MVLGGTNSLVISAACHVVPISATVSSSKGVSEDGSEQVPLLNGHNNAIPKTQETFALSGSNHDIFELHNLSRPQSISESMSLQLRGSTKIEDEQQALIRLSQGVLRWGDVNMPTSFFRRYEDHDGIIGHLGFGGIEHDVQEPVDGHWYA
jgi:hypothetical protein